jgi:hypothetical protein
VICCVAAAITLAFALNFARTVEQHRADSSAILASAGHSTNVQVNRGGLRAQPGRQRSSGQSACILVPAYRAAQRPGRGDAAVETSWPRSLDPIHVRSGRSPPLALS